MHFSAFAPVSEQDCILLQLAYRHGLRKRRRKFDSFRRHVRNLAYGSPVPTEFLYKKRFTEHNTLAITVVPSQRLLVMDIAAGDGWQKLCKFLALPVPASPFPHTHRTHYPSHEPAQSAAAPPAGRTPSGERADLETGVTATR